MTSQLGFGERRRATLETLTDEALDTSAIEGESLSRIAIRSSVARRLGLDEEALEGQDFQADGIAALTVDSSANATAQLTIERIHGWHKLLFPRLIGEPQRIAIGKWRDDVGRPMQVVSGPIGHETVHFEAPPAARLEQEMLGFITWFNDSNEDGILRSARAHLWFLTIHPYEDGNGRIARAIADLLLARDEGGDDRFVSMSKQIRIDKTAYYEVLERTQRGELDVTGWTKWFIACYTRALESALTVINETLNASHFWRRCTEKGISPRQHLVLERILTNWEGNMTAQKWRALTKTSLDTAQRDINDLVEKRILTRNPGGSKNTSYSLTDLMPSH